MKEDTIMSAISQNQRKVDKRKGFSSIFVLVVLMLAVAFLVFYQPWNIKPTKSVLKATKVSSKG